VLTLPPRTRARLGLALDALHDLQDWSAMGPALEVGRAALDGTGPVRAGEVRRILQWAARWERMPEVAQRFYLAMKDEVETCSVALWLVLDGRPVDEWQAEAVRQAWEDRYGVDPPVVLCPPPSTFSRIYRTGPARPKNPTSKRTRG